MTWAVVLEGRADQAAVLLLLDDRPEAEVIVTELLRRGHRVEVRRYQERAAGLIGTSLADEVSTRTD